MNTEQLLVQTALSSWELWLGRTSKAFDSLTDEKMLTEIAPGKNRPVYLLGHLLVVNDAMISQLRLGESAHENLREAFLKQPDRAAIETPSISELRQFWKDTNSRLSELMTELAPADWLEHHALVSEEDFAREPLRNRLAILLSRTSHISYHLGQLILLSK
jgi:hypothetical protein